MGVWDVYNNRNIFVLICWNGGVKGNYVYNGNVNVFFKVFNDVINYWFFFVDFV